MNLGAQARDTEQWLPVVGYVDSYEVSNLGRVRSLDRLVATTGGGQRVSRGRLLRLTARNLYLIVRLYQHGHARGVSVHRAVLEAFVGPCPADMEACHNNGNSFDNRLSNLRWGTHSENNLDRVRHGTHHHAVKTHCIRGHALVPPNLDNYGLKRGKRCCRSCKNAIERVRWQQGDPATVTTLADACYAQIMEGASRDVTVFVARPVVTS